MGLNQATMPTTKFVHRNLSSGREESVEAIRDHEGQVGRSAVHLELVNYLINQSSANKRTISFSLYLDDY